MPITLIFFGDSFVNGVGDPEGLGWVGRVCRDARSRGHDLTAYNLGVRRNLSSDVARRWRAEAAARIADGMSPLLIFSFGVNDCIVESGVRRETSAASRRHAGCILSEASGLAPTVMIGPPPIADPEVNERIENLSSQFVELCRDRSVPFLTTFDVLRATPAWMEEAAAADGAHPGAGGYGAFATVVDMWPAWRRYLP